MIFDKALCGDCLIVSHLTLARINYGHVLASQNFNGLLPLMASLIISALAMKPDYLLRTYWRQTIQKGFVIKAFLPLWYDFLALACLC